jgi:hypothetical protein
MISQLEGNTGIYAGEAILTVPKTLFIGLFLKEYSTSNYAKKCFPILSLLRARERIFRY